MSESNNLDIDQILNKLAELLAQKLIEKQDNYQDLGVRFDELVDRVTDLEDEKFSEDDIRDWISDAINNATITIES